MAHEPDPSRTAAARFQQRSSDSETADPAQTGDPAASAAVVPFDRLLSVAGLTPAQALLIAVQLLDAAQLSGRADGEDRPRACLGTVSLTSSGGIETGDPPAGQATPVTELLEQLVHNARRLPAHPRPEQLLMLRKLEETAREPLLQPSSRARELEGVLTETLGPDARERLTGQLASLVDAFGRVAPSVSASAAPLTAAGWVASPTVRNGHDTAPAPAVPRQPRLRRTSARQAPSRPPRRDAVLLPRRRKGLRLAIVALVLAAALGATGYVLIGGPGADVVQSLGPGSKPAAPGTSSPSPAEEQPANQPQSPRPQALALADRRAGPITGVVVEKTGPCKPGTLCPVKVTVRFRPAATTRAVGWKVGAARLCQRGITWSPPITVTAQPGWTSVYAYSSVRVPKGRSLALVALTTTPARAQARPVPVTGSSLRC